MKYLQKNVGEKATDEKLKGRICVEILDYANKFYKMFLIVYLLLLRYSFFVLFFTQL